MATGAEAEIGWRTHEAARAEPARPRSARVEKLDYRAPGTMSVPARAEPAEGGGEGHPGPVGFAERQAEALARLEARLREGEAAAEARLGEVEREREAAVATARREAEERGRAALDRAVGQIGAALESFRREREDYFAQVEREVVHLALGIAARIAHREVALDPLLLAGAARVALGQLGETTGVRLRCPAGQADRWREMLAAQANLPHPPEVLADPALAPGDCVLEARVGTVDLGVRAQLAEIERGFFDLLERRPGAGGGRPFQWMDGGFGSAAARDGWKDGPTG